MTDSVGDAVMLAVTVTDPLKLKVDSDGNAITDDVLVNEAVADSMAAEDRDMDEVENKLDELDAAGVSVMEEVTESSQSPYSF